ncbi:MAG TPA: PadR family transcriptional regulator [Candidatus Acidoferrales bacterium]|nr:PadR family transcriptional regulator [Candidatus Acidoferrales bacterium]
MKTKKDSEPRAPLSPAMFHVLLALADSDKHGYAIMKEVSRATNGEVSLSAGTLYGILRRLVTDDMVVEKDERPSPELDDERRRYYRLTEHGRKIAQAEARRLEEMLELAHAKRLYKRPVSA